MWQLALSPRWLVWHVLTLGAVATCAWLAAWQWGRAGSAMGSALNVGYGLQWPAFAVFFAFMWWRMLRMETMRLREERVAAAPDPAVTPEAAATPEPVVDAEPGADAESGAARTGPARVPPPVDAPVTGPPDPAEPPAVEVAAPPARARSPFGPRPHDAPAPPEADRELAEYNRMLAGLAAAAAGPRAEDAPRNEE